MRQPWWEWGLWQYRVSVAQANGAGGAITVDIVAVAGESMKVQLAMGLNSGTNGLVIQLTDTGDNLITEWLNIASGAGTKGVIPRMENDLTASSFRSSSHDIWIREQDKLTIRQTGAGAQNDTLVVAVRAFLSCAERPIVLKARSTNAADVTIATPTLDVIH